MWGSTPVRLGVLGEYAGGISTVNDLVRLREFGFNYAIVGMGFYNGALRGVRFV